MDTGNDPTGADIRTIQQNYKESHKRLRDPPNAVADTGINLRKNYVNGVHPSHSQPIERTEPPLPPQIPPTLPENIPPCWTGKLYTNRIIDITAEHFGVRRADILGHERRTKYVRPRHMVCYLLRELTHKSFPLIGQIVGGKDHTTTLYAYKRIARDLKENHRGTAAHYSNIMAVINDGTPYPGLGLPAVAEPVVAVQLENQKSLSQPKIYFLAEASGKALVDAKTAKFSSYFWPIYGGDYPVAPRQEAPGYRQSLEGFAGCIAELASYRK